MLYTDPFHEPALHLSHLHCIPSGIRVWSPDRKPQVFRSHFYYTRKNGWLAIGIPPDPCCPGPFHIEWTPFGWWRSKAFDCRLALLKRGGYRCDATFWFISSESKVIWSITACSLLWSRPETDPKTMVKSKTHWQDGEQNSRLTSARSDRRVSLLKVWTVNPKHGKCLQWKRLEAKSFLNLLRSKQLTYYTRQKKTEQSY